MTDLRSFMGLKNQLAELILGISAAAQPLRPLIISKRHFLWTPDHDEVFRHVVLASLDLTVHTILLRDVCYLYGVGFALLQEHGGVHLRLIQCGSRFLTHA